ncbi:MAG: hypothetical protein WD491_01020 [Balneolales bacterium]
MRIERKRPTVLELTIHSSELAALIAAARWVTEGAKGELPDQAVEQLQKVLANYDSEIQRTVKDKQKT